MSQIAGLQDFRKQGPPADIGTFQVPTSLMIFQHTFSGTTYHVCMRGGERSWVLIDIDVDARTVLQAAHDALPNGGEIFIVSAGAAYYDIAVAVAVTNNGVSWVGCGKTVLRMANTPPAINMFEVDAEDTTFKQLTFDGNKANVSDSAAHTLTNILYIGGSSVRTLVTGCRFYDVNSHAIVTPLGEAATETLVHNCYFRGCDFWSVAFAAAGHSACTSCVVDGGAGIEAASGRNVLADNIVKDVDATGADKGFIITGNGNVVVGNNIYNAVAYPISLEGTFNVCVGNYVEEAPLYAIIALADDNLIVGNTVNGTEAGGRGVGIVGADRTFVSGNKLNADVGIYIHDATCVDNMIGRNNLAGCATKITDNGTGTMLPHVTFQFVKEVGTATWLTTSPTGIEIDAADEGAIAHGWVPVETQQVVRFRIAGVILAAPGVGNQMRLEIIVNAGKPVGHEGYNAEAISVANKNNTEENPAINDVVEWVITASDDADVDDIENGESFECIVKHEIAGNSDIATDVAVRTVTVEYV